MKNEQLFEQMMNALTRGKVSHAKQEKEQAVLMVRTSQPATQEEVDLLIQKHAQRTRKARA